MSTNGPKNQSGAALIVVLVMMSLGIMLSLSAVQSSVIGERLAGNYRAMTQAEMNAERGLSEFHEWLADSDCESDGWKSDKDNLSWDGYEITYVSDCVAGYVTVTAEGLAGGAIGIANATFKKPGLPNIQADAAFTCFGEDCNFVIGSANSSSGKHLAASGIDYENQCFSGNVGNATINEYRKAKAGVIMPEGEFSQQSGKDKDKGKGKGKGPGGGSDDGTTVSGVNGSPPLVTNDAQYSSVYGVDPGSMLDDSIENSGLRQRIEKHYNSLYEILLSLDNPENSGFYYAGEGETVSVSGDSSGVIILEGGTLDMRGSACFQGLVIARPSGGYMPEITSKGTPVILGAVMGEGLTVGQNGNPNILYSSKALDFGDNGAPGGDKPIQIESWVAGEAAEENPMQSQD